MSRRFCPLLAVLVAVTAHAAAVDDIVIFPPDQVIPNGAVTTLFGFGDFDGTESILGNGTLAGGGNHNCAVISNGSVRCWGRNGSGQLGNNTTTDSNVPVQVGGLTNAVALSGGFTHTCALRADGGVSCWGQNDAGQIGNGTTTNAISSVGVTSLGGSAIAVGAGFQHSCAVLSTGGVRCWGSNASGQLGNGTTTSSTTPVSVTGISNALAIAVGGLHTCALLFDGTMRCWGANNAGQLAMPAGGTSTVPVTIAGLSGIAAIATGFDHSCALLVDGGMRCWGRNFEGELGNGTQNASTSTPVVVNLVGQAVAIAAGGGHTCAIIAGGSMQCWGDNGNGQIGLGSLTGVFPTPMVVGGSGDAIALALGFSHTCALRAAGPAECWGLNDGGQLGHGVVVQRVGSPVTVNGTGAVISAGGKHSCALAASGRVNCWGDNFYAQLGFHSDTNPNIPVPVLDANQEIITASALALGYEHSCAISHSATWCWGRNSTGQIGTGTLTGPDLCNGQGCSRIPRQVVGQLTPVALAAGASHNCQVTIQGGVQCWGNNNFGQLGDGTVASSGSARNVTGITTAIAVAAGFEHSCAVLADGSARCWGHNNEGQLGNGSNNDSPTPVIVSGITTATAIAAGDAHNCVRLSTAEIRCWGRGDEGQLGNSGNADSNVSVDTANDSGASDVVAGAFHSCLRAGTFLRCWGLGSSGQLGIGVFESRNSPLAVSGINTALSVDAGAAHTCAILSGNVLRCWGNNQFRQLANGTANVALAGPVFGMTLDSVALAFTSSDPAVAAIAMSGGAKGVALGAVTITARYGPASATTTLEVAPDTDGDTLADPVDNCSAVANPDQRDTDADDYGNPCDGDLDNSDLVTVQDFNLLRNAVNLACPVAQNSQACNADLNGSGLVTSVDFNIFRALLNKPPGPSGVAER